MKSLNIPENTHPLAKLFIEDLVDQLKKDGKYNKAYDMNIYMLCLSLSYYIIATEEINNELLVEGRLGNPVSNPLLVIQKDNKRLAMQILETFGGSLYSNKRLKASGEDSDEEPLLAAFINKQKK